MCREPAHYLDLLFRCPLMEVNPARPARVRAVAVERVALALEAGRRQVPLIHRPISESVLVELGGPLQAAPVGMTTTPPADQAGADPGR